MLQTQSIVPVTPENLSRSHARVESRMVISKLALGGIELAKKE